MPAYKDTNKTTGEIRWRYRFWLQGKRYGGSTPINSNTKRAADKLERRHIDKLMAGQYTGTMPTLAEFSVRFLDYQKPPRTAPMTYRQQNDVLRLHVLPRWGQVKLDAVNKALIDAMVSEWTATAALTTINTRLAVIRHMLALGVDWEILTRIPKVKSLKPDKATPRFLSDEEMYTLVEKTEPKWRTMVVVALRTGLRIGELRGLQWGDVDFTRRVIQVRRTDPGKLGMAATSPKGKRERTVPLTNDAINALTSERPDKPKSTDYVWPASPKNSKRITQKARSEGGCWHAIGRAARLAGLDDVGWHTLRHTYASHLVMRGIPIRTIQQWLGHSSIVMTEKYSHLAPEFGHGSANLLDTPLPTPVQHAAKALPEIIRECTDSATLPSKE